jgi:KaiC/GvpD/RAD55 family RecA-like ATPase
VIPLEFSIQDMKEHDLYLIMSSASEIRNKNIELIKKILAEDYYVLVITTNQLFEVLKRSYEKNGVHMEKIYVVDAVTKYAMGHDPTPVKNCRFVSNPANLTDIGIAVTETLKELHEKKVCLLFDSVNSMLIYISSQNITKFIHFVTNKLRLLKFTGIFLAVEKGLDPDVLTQLTTFVDEVIDADKDALHNS